MKFKYLIICIAVAAMAANVQADAQGKKKGKAKTPAKVVVEPEPEPEPAHPLLDSVAPEKQSLAREMLDRVESIQLIGKLHVDSARFFTRYEMSRDAGLLMAGEWTKIRAGEYVPRVVYGTENCHERLWAQPADSALVLMSARALDDGTWDEPYELSAELRALGGDSDFPYMLQDGYTIYFANNGENSLGGYDIFMTRRSPEGDVLQPQNVGMPFNSPFNDYMMVIDETTGLGWWASDREHIPGKVTIYVYRPSQMRVNLNPDTPDIEDRALLNVVEISEDLEEVLRSVPLARDIIEVLTKPSLLSIYVNGKVVDSPSDLRNPQAVQAFKQANELQAELESTRAQLSELRARYAAGDKSVADSITALENRLLTLPLDIKRLVNKAISLEK